MCPARVLRIEGSPCVCPLLGPDGSDLFTRKFVSRPFPVSKRCDAFVAALDWMGVRTCRCNDPRAYPAERNVNVKGVAPRPSAQPARGVPGFLWKSKCERCGAPQRLQRESLHARKSPASEIAFNPLTVTHVHTDGGRPNVARSRTARLYASQP